MAKAEQKLKKYSSKMALSQNLKFSVKKKSRCFPIFFFYYKILEQIFYV
jgi:hypothetical protein